MKNVLFVTMVLFSSVAFAHHRDPVDVNCQKMAENARGFAELKQGGIATTETDLEKFVVSPTVQTYPVKSLLEYVMNQDDQNPDHVYSNLYQKCTLMGYKELLNYFDEREEVDRLNVVLSQKDQTINGLRDTIAQLQQENTALKFPPKKTFHHERREKRHIHTHARISSSLPPGCTLSNGKPCPVRR